MFRFPWYFTLTIRQVCNFTLRNISKKKNRKKNENIFLTYMSISHSLSPRLALVDIHISSSCSCRMSSVAHTHTQLLRYMYIVHPRKLWIPQCALLSFIAFYGAADILLYYYARYVAFFPPSLSLRLSTQPTGRGDCAPAAPATIGTSWQCKCLPNGQK